MLGNNKLLRGVAIGLGAAVLVPVAIAALAPVVCPLARSALKSGVRVYEKGREKFELLGETVDDIVAEVEDELQEERAFAEQSTEEDAPDTETG